MAADGRIFLHRWAALLAGIVLLAAGALVGSVATAKTGRTPFSSAVKMPNKPAPGEQSAGGGASNALQGLSVEELMPPIANRLGLPLRTKGVVVTNIDPTSPAAESGLRRGDVIQEVNRRPVSNESEFENAVQQAGNQSLLFLVNRQGVTMYLAIQP